METKEYRTADKSTWGEGPWLTEPDKVQWQDEATGLPCLIVRNSEITGALCGYVGLPEGHPDFNKDYDDVPVEVHGGLTFASFGSDSDDETRHICHKPAPGEPDHVWWLGFDCSHAGDTSPAMNARHGHNFGWEESYRAIGYVKAEVTRLAEQLKARAA